MFHSNATYDANEESLLQWPSAKNLASFHLFRICLTCYIVLASLAWTGLGHELSDLACIMGFPILPSSSHDIRAS